MIDHHLAEIDQHPNAGPKRLVQYRKGNLDALPDMSRPEDRGWLLTIKYCFTPGDVSSQTPYRVAPEKLPSRLYNHETDDLIICRTFETFGPHPSQPDPQKNYVINAICLPKAPPEFTVSFTLTV